ncbi:MAG: glycosyltransferase [Nitrospirae bacterium]|nr:glycosyltransferase [Nitrospirota bacterium]
MTAKLTVLLPVYNGLLYLPQAVNSILNQTMPDFKFLIIDDGSTDGTAEYLDRLQDPRLLIVHQANIGLGATLNRGLDMCNTEFIARMDADDISFPNRFQQQLSYMVDHPNVVMVGTQVDFIVNTKIFPGPRTPVKHSEIQRLLNRGKAAICHPSIMVRTTAIKEIGGYRIRGAGEETDLFLRMCEVGEVVNLNEVLHLMRLHRLSTCYVSWSEVKLGYAYAIHCAKCRSNNMKEPSFEGYRISWSEQDLLGKISNRIDGWSAREYRDALIDIADGKKLRGYIKLGCAAIFRLEGVARRISGRIRSWGREC